MTTVGSGVPMLTGVAAADGDRAVGTPDRAAVQPAVNAIHHRADIQGLRAIAVVLVILFHAQVPGLDGGFVGVDVFYGISGYLIVGLILQEVRATGRLAIGRFWARRARRLVPMSLVVLLATVVATRLTAPPTLLTGVSRDAVATSVYLANVHFASDAVDYLGNSGHSPFLHYWSLAVEEQFYVLFPLLVGLVVLAARRPIGWLIWILTVGSVVSFVLCVEITQRWQPWAFFTLPTRAWELAAGGLAAVAVQRHRSRIAPYWARWVGWGGLALVAFATVTFSEGSLFPGWRAAIPIVGSVALLVSGAVATGPLQRFLSWPPLTYIGDLSYSLYLWHWPALVVPAAALRRSLTASETALAVTVGVVLSVASYYLIEDPVRRWQVLAKHSAWSLGGAAVATGLAVSAGLWVGQLPRLHTGQPAAVVAGGPVPSGYTPQFVPSNAVPTVGDARTDLSDAFTDGCLQGISAAPKMCSFGVESDRTIVIMGDSHAEMWFPALQEVAGQHGYRLVTLLKGSCPPADVRAFSKRLHRAYHECDTWRERAIDTIRDLRPEFVVLSGFRGESFDGDDSPEVRAEGIRATVARVSDLGAETFWIGDGPYFVEDVPTCLSVSLRDPADCAVARADALFDVDPASEEAAVEDGGGQWIPGVDWLCPGARCEVLYGQYVMYRDHHHISATYSRTFAEQFAVALGLP